MHRRHAELWVSLVAILAITAAYALAYQQRGRFPAASGLVGHGIGVLGFTLMLMTETLYSIRKQATNARWGSMAAWLKFHMMTGIVGPYMVLLHTSMKFRGLAGVALLLTAVVVISGLVGRYIYTAVPRASGLAETGGSDPGSIVAQAPLALGDMPSTDPPGTGTTPPRFAASRRALASWHSIHVPLTWALFVTAFAHAGAALYYATLQR